MENFHFSEHENAMPSWKGTKSNIEWIWRIIKMEYRSKAYVSKEKLNKKAKFPRLY
jgi:UDP-N-acetyl-D-mannosaminuronic acid transferase (WecB/TagA/CpsF family)